MTVLVGVKTWYKSTKGLREHFIVYPFFTSLLASRDQNFPIPNSRYPKITKFPRNNPSKSNLSPSPMATPFTVNSAGAHFFFPYISLGQDRRNGQYSQLRDAKLSRCKWHMYLLNFLQEQWDNQGVQARNQGLVIRIYKVVTASKNGFVNETEITSLWGHTRKTQCCPQTEALGLASEGCESICTLFYLPRYQSGHPMLID
jgi:hypothetical protein